ncbi:MAG: hypothetical protein GWP19_03930 [Planctomycetia bacterium]|nr:hypothetical protein [Planctomycetia bacterium]
MKDNKLIAKFMGKSVDNIRPEMLRIIYKYHSSWNWLKPVVRKITLWKMQNEEGDWKNYSFSDMEDALSFCGIDSVYKEVVKFIKYIIKSEG